MYLPHREYTYTYFYVNIVNINFNGMKYNCMSVINTAIFRLKLLNFNKTTCETEYNCFLCACFVKRFN